MAFNNNGNYGNYYQQMAQQNTDRNNMEDILRGLQIANAASNMDTASLIGYGLGKLAKNYYDRNLMNNQRDKLNMQENPSTSAGQSAVDNSMMQAKQQAEGEAANYDWNVSPYALLGKASQTSQAMANNAAAQPVANGQLQAQQQASMAAAQQANQQEQAKQQAQKQMVFNMALNSVAPGAGAVASKVAGNDYSFNVDPAELLGKKSVANAVSNAAGNTFNINPADLLGKRPFDEASATNAGQEANNVYQEARQAIQAQENTPLNYVGRKIANGLISAKMAYKVAETAYKKAEAEGSQEGMDASMRAMDNARKMAESYRKSADAAGVDVSQFGAGVTLEDAAQNLTNDYYRGIQNLLGNNISSDEYYQNVFDIVKKNGGTDTQARQIAAEKAGIYQAKRIANLTDAFQNYGLNEGGSYNDVGARIIMSLLQENPTTANALATQYGTPKDDYKNAQVLNAIAEKAIEQANIANLNAQLRAGLLDRAHVNRMQEAAQKAQYDAYIKSLYGSGNSSTKEEGNSAQAKTYVGKLMSKYKSIINAFDNGEYGEKGNTISDFQALVEEARPHLNEEQQNYFNAMDYALHAVQAANNGDNDLAADYKDSVEKAGYGKYFFKKEE